MGQQPRRGLDRVRLSEAAAYERNDATVWRQVLQRECGIAPGSPPAILPADLCDRCRSPSPVRRGRCDCADALSISGFEQLATRLAALGHPDEETQRAFRLAPVAASTDASPIASRVDVGDARAPLPVSRLVTPAVQLSPQDNLRPEIVQPFLDVLQREHPGRG